MATDLKAIMQRDKRRRRMLNDPDLVRDALLFALALDEVILTREEEHRRHRRATQWVLEVAALARGGDDGSQLLFWGKQVLANDVPRYEFEGLRGPSACPAPMIRRDGLCGKPGSVRLVDRDPLTGEGKWVSLCARHRHLEAQFLERQREWITNGRPQPPANTGGVLKRYYGGNWDGIYRWAAPYRDPLPGGREATPPRPRLRLIPGGAMDVDRSAEVTE